jgi:hypothetical protein
MQATERSSQDYAEAKGEKILRRAKIITIQEHY